ncbi:MAG: alpha/beta fold hydrolase [Bacteroidales bacterium]|nr:alpha/beta fold hydrolase [Bacteroidales bacterium]
MNQDLIQHNIKEYQTSQGISKSNFQLTYQIFGKKLHSAPIVLVNHALTGNSDVISESKGWWKTLVGKNKLIDTKKYTVIAINIPGNAYDGLIIKDYQNYTTKDIAQLFILTLKAMGVEKLFAVIGGSLGGGLAWEMAVLEPEMIEYVIPIAAYWQSCDWIIGFNDIQMQILNHSDRPLEIARMMAMMFYRTPKSMAQKFQRTKTKDGSLFNIESWLRHHGDKLNKRFEFSAYQMMTHLLTTLDITNGKDSFEDAVKPIKSTIIQIAIDTDWLFVKDETIQTKVKLDQLGVSNQYHEIKSIHGHDAFLIEFEQLEVFLNPIFK